MADRIPDTDIVTKGIGLRLINAMEEVRENRDRTRHERFDRHRRCTRRGCQGVMWLARPCGAYVCDVCEYHDGLVRCFCGWAASGGDGYQELRDMGETIEGDGDE